MIIIKICVAYKKVSQQQEPSYMHMTKVKRARELLHTDIIGSISFIDHNKARFIVYGVNNIFKIYFKECIKEKKTFRVFCA